MVCKLFVGGPKIQMIFYFSITFEYTPSLLFEIQNFCPPHHATIRMDVKYKFVCTLHLLIKLTELWAIRRAKDFFFMQGRQRRYPSKPFVLLLLLLNSTTSAYPSKDWSLQYSIFFSILLKLLKWWIAQTVNILYLITQSGLSLSNLSTTGCTGCT